MTSRSILVSTAITLVIAFSFSACGLQTGGLPSDGSGGGAPVDCATDADCDDGNPCTTSSCDTANGICLRPVVLDKFPDDLQTAGDCKTLSCKNGEPVSQADDKDFLSDGNDCTVDQCESGAPVHAAVPEGTACSINAAAGSCQKGECFVECGPGKAPCDDKEPCTTDACDGQLGKCKFIPLVEGTPTPGSDDKTGNCKVDVCVGGKAQVLTDNSDTPSAQNDCQEGSCNAGVPMPKFFPADTKCGPNMAQFCDGSGTCVACNKPSQCGADDDCNTFSCDNHTCKVAFTPDNTPVSAAMGQVAKDCHVILCDGTGKTKDAVDDTDLPDDNNQCTNDLCTAGVPSHTNVMVGTACGNGSTCTLDGKCGCMNDMQCPSPQTCGGGGTAGVCGCTPKSCGALGKFCGVTFDGCYDNMLDCNDSTKNAGETDVDCGGPNCSVKCAIGKICSANSDCASGFCADGRCCDGACNGPCQACNLAGNIGTCSPIIANVDNNPANICAGGNVCDATGTCKKDVGQVCAANSECALGFCVDGRCCDGACTGTCKACNLAGKLGQCSDIPANSTDNNATVTCVGTNVCDGSGGCKKIDGQVCAAGTDCFHPNCVDGVCCNGACGGTCQACNLAASMGTCTNIPSGQTDSSPACNGNNACNGSGACKKIIGQPCAAVGDCVSNFCADGVCCDGACSTACRACNLAGSIGTCSNITSGTDNSPANVCVAPNACDANGTCKKTNGQPCSANGDCVGGVCLDGFCCGAASCGTCQACTGANGTCVNLALNVQDTVPANTCTGNNTCDGAGNCKSKLGQGCLNGGTCASGNCADFVCCDAACGGLCQACVAIKKGAGADGICGFIANNTDPDTECGATSCNGAGACSLKALGAACANNNECTGNACVDGFCCGSASCATCKACTGANGTCVNITAGNQDNVPANACTGNNVCDGSGACKLKNGQACPGNPSGCASGICADGVCCENACTGTCKSCAVAGFEGTCTNLPVGVPDNNATVTCTAPNACTGGGACKLANGQSCAGGASTCASGHCADTVCCDTDCLGMCMSCTTAKKNAGVDGICSFIQANQDPDNECQSPMKCDGAGMCQ